MGPRPPVSSTNFRPGAMHAAGLALVLVLAGCGPSRTPVFPVKGQLLDADSPEQDQREGDPEGEAPIVGDVQHGDGPEQVGNRKPIECAVENQSRRFVIGRPRYDQVAANLGSKRSDLRGIHRSHILLACCKNSSHSGKHLDSAFTERGRRD